MIFILKMLFSFVYDLKNKNHWSLLIIRYSLLITQITNTLMNNASQALKSDQVIF